MKKLFIVFCFFGCLASANAQTRLVSTCVKFNFLGIVSVWSGSMNTETFNPLTNQWDVTSSRACGNDGGSWDWFWDKW